MTRSAKRLLWATGGCLSLLLALIGVPLPLLPTTPFVILAAFCFSKSSERLHNWLLNHKIFGPSIRDWNETGSIPLKAKILATVMMAGAFLLAWAFHAPPHVLIAQLTILPLVGLFIWSRPGSPHKN